jgi:hypothetical protein
MYHHRLQDLKTLGVYEWEQKSDPFRELLISWNANRPKMGQYAIAVSVKRNDWSPWFSYAEWRAEGQRSGHVEADGVWVYQDAVELSQDGTAFRVRVKAEGGATLQGFKSLHVCANCLQVSDCEPIKNVRLAIPGVSQMVLTDERKRRLCSPISMTAILRYLGRSVDPIAFAEKVWDEKFDIFGNWVFNTAQGYAELGGEWSCWVEKLSGLGRLHELVSRGMPVVISVRGPLLGSAQAYEKGHLLVVCGFEGKEVLCMDPAFPTDALTHVRYGMEDLMRAWERRSRIAYVFSKSFP